MAIGTCISSTLTNDATSIVSRPNRTATRMTAVWTAANNAMSANDGAKVIGRGVGEQPAPVVDDVVHGQSQNHRRHRERAPPEEHEEHEQEQERQHGRRSTRECSSPSR